MKNVLWRFPEGGLGFAYLTQLFVPSARLMIKMSKKGILWCQASTFLCEITTLGNKHSLTMKSQPSPSGFNSQWYICRCFRESHSCTVNTYMFLGILLWLIKPLVSHDYCFTVFIVSLKKQQEHMPCCVDVYSKKQQRFLVKNRCISIFTEIHQ